MSALAWQGAIGCEGGPVIIANAADFAHWTGTTPLPRSERRELHFWSPFTSELPAAFRPCGPAGHQFIPAATYSELEHLRDELIAYVVGRWPGTTIEERLETWVVTRPDGARLHVEFDPTSEYDRCCRGLDDLKVHTFDRHRRAIIWSVEPGIVHVARTATGRLLLAQVRYAEDDDMADEVVGHVLDAEPPAPVSDSLMFDVSPGPLVVAWAPNSADDEGEGVVHDDTSTAMPGEILDLSTGGSGVALAMPAGRYAARAATMEGDIWGVSWCAFERMTAAPQGDAADPPAAGR